jgi:hypothetical protein
MQTIDTTQLAPAAAATLALPRKRARVDLPAVNGREVSIWLSVSYEESTRAYHGFLTRTVHEVNGDQTTLITEGPYAPSAPPSSPFWRTLGQLDALYARLQAVTTASPRGTKSHRDPTAQHA